MNAVATQRQNGVELGAGHARCNRDLHRDPGHLPVPFIVAVVGAMLVIRP